jgi:rare lipoprotein A
LCVLGVLAFFGCARERYYVKAVELPGSKGRGLPETVGGATPRPYVVNGERYYPLPKSHGFVQLGAASWYGGEFHGKPTSSGEIFNMYSMTAAHKVLPFGTYVEVLNLSNGQRTVVRINDRGPFVKDRIIDLSRAAANNIGLIGPGVGDVKIIALGKEIGKSESGPSAGPILEAGGDLEKGEFTVQVGAFKERGNALSLADRMRGLFEYVNVVEYPDVDTKTIYRVHVSKSESLSQAGKMERRLEDMGFSDAFVVRI